MNDDREYREQKGEYENVHVDTGSIWKVLIDARVILSLILSRHVRIGMMNGWFDLRVRGTHS